MTDKTKYALYLMITVIVLGGCFPTPPSTKQTASPSVSASSTSEDSLPVIFTATVLPGLVPPPTPEYPKLVTPHITPFPTRTRAEVREELTYMLQTNGDCTFPCFWGIYPDQTRYEELYGVIDRLGGHRFENLQENGDIRVSTDFIFHENSGASVSLQANLQNNIVKDLKILLTNLFRTGVTPEDWSAYNMDEILRTYGVPDAVELSYSGPYNALSFDIRLKYENIDTSITYYAGTTETDKYLTPSNAIFCPEEIGIDIVELHMGKRPFNTGPDGVPLSKATGLDEQAFHKLFTEDPSPCLTLNREAMQ